MTKTPRPMPTDRIPGSEQPLVDDIRLLGRILGDVIREQEGDSAFALVEQIRQLSVAFRRDANHEADKTLNKLLKSLSNDQTVSVVRAFTYFSHLANLAEDRHHIRRRLFHKRAGSLREGSIDLTLQRLAEGGITPDAIGEMLANSFVSPVLTAHPTEVQRKSILMPSATLRICSPRVMTFWRRPQAIRCPMTHWPRANWPTTNTTCGYWCCSSGKLGCCAFPS